MQQGKGLAVALPIKISETSSALVSAALCLVSFFAPFALGHPQWFIGTIVNTCLFLAAIYLPKKYFVPLAVLPSLGVLTRGIIFGPFTVLLVYFLPFIWLGNFALIFVFKYLFARAGFFFSGVLASAAKFLLLYSCAGIYFKFSIVPAIFLQAMGLNQLATALAGWVISFLFLKIIKTFKKWE